MAWGFWEVRRFDGVGREEWGRWYTEFCLASLECTLESFLLWLWDGMYV